MSKQTPEQRYEWLYHKYSHIGCPAAHMEDNCAHPDRCADNGRCIELGPNPFERTGGERQMKHFDPTKRKHWPIIEAYQDKRLSRAQAEAQLKDLGCVGWEIALYLDNDQIAGDA